MVLWTLFSQCTFTREYRDLFPLNIYLKCCGRHIVRITNDLIYKLIDLHKGCLQTGFNRDNRGVGTDWSTIRFLALWPCGISSLAWLWELTSLTLPTKLPQDCNIPEIQNQWLYGASVNFSAFHELLKTHLWRRVHVMKVPIKCLWTKCLVIVLARASAITGAH